MSDRSLAAENVSHHFGGARALDDVSFVAVAGEIHALVGENGAGKSTLVRVLSGALNPDEGQLLLDGVPVRARSPRDAQRLGIAVVHQDYHLFPQLTIAANLALLAGQAARRAPWVSGTMLKRTASSLLRRYDVAVDPARLANTLSAAERKIIEVVGALSLQPRYLVLDEPTAAMEPRERHRLFELMRHLRREGIGVIFVTHRLGEVLELADRATVLRNGRVAGVLTRGDDLTPDNLVTRILGRRPDAAASSASPTRTGEALRVRVRLGPTRSPVDLSVCAGEVVGVVGLVGSGASELLRAVGGALEGAHVDMRVAGRDVVLSSPRQALSLGVGYVPEDRKVAGVFPSLSVAENLALSALDGVSRRGWLDRKDMRRRAQELCSRLDVRCESVRQPLSGLSGGNQQKVLLGRMLARRCAVLVIEEPTQGVDVGARAEIHRLLRRTAEEDGTAVLFLSADLDEVLGLADRVVVIHDLELSAVVDNHPAGADAPPLAQREVLVAKAAGL